MLKILPGQRKRPKQQEAELDLSTPRGRLRMAAQGFIRQMQGSPQMALTMNGVLPLLNQMLMSITDCEVIEHCKNLRAAVDYIETGRSTPQAFGANADSGGNGNGQNYSGEGTVEGLSSGIGD